MNRELYEKLRDLYEKIEKKIEEHNYGPAHWMSQCAGDLEELLHENKDLLK